MNLQGQKPEIVYPCQWEYRVIGSDEKRLREIIFENMPREYEVCFGRASSAGHYVSLHVNLVVESEKERDEIFQALQAYTEIKMVL